MKVLCTCMQVRRCLTRMQHAVVSGAWASWRGFTERRAAKQSASVLHVARIQRKALSAFRYHCFSPISPGVDVQVQEILPCAWSSGCNNLPHTMPVPMSSVHGSYQGEISKCDMLCVLVEPMHSMLQPRDRQLLYGAAECWHFAWVCGGAWQRLGHTRLRRSKLD